MNSDKDICTQLLDGWVLCKSKSNPGRKYYFNRKTGKSSWTKPEAVDNPCNSKKAAKMEKKRLLEKNKKEDIRKRAFKRKSEGNNDVSSREKCRKEHHREVHKRSQQKAQHQKLSQQKIAHEKGTHHREQHSKKDSSNINNKVHTNAQAHSGQSSKKCLPKNLANNRLSILRSNLSKEVVEESCKSTEGKKAKASPKNNQNDNANKTQKSELKAKSPISNESKCTVTSQSPSSDSLQSTPSPSQFFAANKIISSMKAQLPEEYNIKVKQKDTFADIEQGIYNQMNDYPFNKHPATPPQFSEATKLVSAIKSKLTYKLTVPEEGSVMTFANAKERMEVLRRSITETENVSDMSNRMDTADKINISQCKEKSPEAMEVEDIKEIVPSGPESQSEMKNVSVIQTNFVLVVDTNVFIHELSFIKNVLNSHIKGYNEKPTLLIPWRVINELDRLKDNNNGTGALCKRARAAMDFLYNTLPDNDRIKGQSLRDANSHIYPCEVPDDEILNCCLQQVERAKSVLLLTNDKNLCNKATLNEVRSINVEGLRFLMESKPEPVVDPGLSIRMKHYEDTMFKLLASILESEMRAKYGRLWQHVVHRAPPWRLRDVLASLLKHWRTLFCEVFPRIDQLLTDLAAALDFATDKNPRALSESEVVGFKELCRDIAEKCRIIPDYMDLAKEAVENLSRDPTSAPVPTTPVTPTHVPTTPIPSAHVPTTSVPGTPVTPNVPATPLPHWSIQPPHNAPVSQLVEAFECVWTLFSGYCAKLCTCLGLQHSLEDHLPGDRSPDQLCTEWPLFRRHVNALTLAIKGILSVGEADIFEEQISNLEMVLKESLGLMMLDGGVVTRDELRIFCVGNRGMLQEAYTKLSQLTELLDVCKSKMQMHN